MAKYRNRNRYRINPGLDPYRHKSNKRSYHQSPQPANPTQTSRSYPTTTHSWQRLHTQQQPRSSLNVEDLLQKLLNRNNNKIETEPLPEEPIDIQELPTEMPQLNLEPTPREILDPSIRNEASELPLSELPINIEAPHFDGIEDLFQQIEPLCDTEAIEIPTESEAPEHIEDDLFDQAIEAGGIY